MSYLLDTNALIGLLFCPDILSEDANRIMQESEELSVSIASLGTGDKAINREDRY